MHQISVKANKKVIQNVVDDLMQLVATIVKQAHPESTFPGVTDLDNAPFKDAVQVPRADLPLIFGRNRNQLLAMMATHHVTFWWDDRTTTESEVTIHMTGPTEQSVQAAKQAVTVGNHVVLLPISHRSTRMLSLECDRRRR